MLWGRRADSKLGDKKFKNTRIMNDFRCLIRWDRKEGDCIPIDTFSDYRYLSYGTKIRNWGEYKKLCRA